MTVFQLLNQLLFCYGDHTMKLVENGDIRIDGKLLTTIELGQTVEDYGIKVYSIIQYGRWGKLVILPQHIGAKLPTTNWQWQDYRKFVNEIINAKDFEPMRRGQLAMNRLAEKDFELYDRVSQTNADCFYDDEKLPDLFAFIATHVEETTPA